MFFQRTPRWRRWRRCLRQRSRSAGGHWPTILGSLGLSGWDWDGWMGNHQNHPNGLKRFRLVKDCEIYPEKTWQFSGWKLEADFGWKTLLRINAENLCVMCRLGLATKAKHSKKLNLFIAQSHVVHYFMQLRSNCHELSAWVPSFGWNSSPFPKDFTDRVPLDQVLQPLVLGSWTRKKSPSLEMCKNARFFFFVFSVEKPWLWKYYTGHSWLEWFIWGSPILSETPFYV